MQNAQPPKAATAAPQPTKAAHVQQPLGVQVVETQRTSMPVPLNLPENLLQGAGTAYFHPAGPKHDQGREMFAFFSGGFGLLSDFEGESPMRFGVLQHQQEGGRLLIDLMFPGEPGETHYGICELSGNKARLCFCGDQYHTINGRPKSFEEADPRAYHKVVLNTPQRGPHPQPKKR